MYICPLHRSSKAVKKFQASMVVMSLLRFKWNMYKDFRDASCESPSINTFKQCILILTGYSCAINKSIELWEVLGVYMPCYPKSTRCVEHSTGTSNRKAASEMKKGNPLGRPRPEVFFFIASWALARSFLGFWPSKTWMATNEAEAKLQSSGDIGWCWMMLDDVGLF